MSNAKLAYDYIKTSEVKLALLTFLLPNCPFDKYNELYITRIKKDKTVNHPLI